MNENMLKMLEEYKKEGCGRCPEDSIFLYINGKPISFKEAKEKINAGDRKFIRQVFSA